jgi:hypothetical protein
LGNRPPLQPGAHDQESLRRHHAERLIVLMSLIRDAYRAEILGGLADHRLM